ncbi:ParB/RepB/Spo0J family partition protein [Flavobacterium sp. 25HG05S-40]|uniref:ParB/RepB/Spo0J family partition protein n=1 Tax=Flavobacterium sp. 25HG05S-40 TaxID=3458682 RepID=UPI004045031F
MSTQIADLKMIRIEEIVVSTTNPRKTFEEKALQELTESIKEHGILQPILVRPVPPLNSNNKAKYELVCGERRYRASVKAGLETIPCNVRDLTHDEAFEMQIVENLERKDVHPLDEADAFKRMLDSGKYSMFDIAAKMAKTESFIAQRLKLVDLIEEIRTDFLAGYLGIGHAVLIARCTAEKQMEIYDDAKPWNGSTDDPNYGTLSDIKEKTEDDTTELSTAKFDINDDKLLKDCGACTNCPKRSGANPVLFADMQDDVCFDSTCFEKKTQAVFHKEVARIINDGEQVVFIAGYSKPDDFIIQLCKQFGVKILKQYDEWNTPPRLSETPAKAFCVSGQYEGEYMDVSLKIKATVEMEVAASSGNGKEPMNEEQIQISEEITKIKERQARALELDGEKVWQKIRELPTKAIKESKGDLSQNEINALCYAMIEKLGYYGNSEIKKNIIDLNYDTAKTHDFTKEQYNQISRIFFVNTLPTAIGSHDNVVQNVFYVRMLNEYSKKEIDSFEAEQLEIANKRIARAEERIKELQGKLEKLKPEPVADKKKSKKA